MSVSQPSASIDISGLPPRVVEAVTQITAVCHRQLGSQLSAEAFEETERRVRESVYALRGAEARDDGAPRIERDGWFRVAPKTIMTSPDDLSACRTGARCRSLMPADESLVDDYLTRPAAWADDDGRQRRRSSASSAP